MSKLNIQRKTHLVDANNQILGRLATKIADLLRGKQKIDYASHLDIGDSVIVVNAAHIITTGKKLNDKTYYWHTSYPGGLRQIILKDLIAKDATIPLRKAVYGMLPKNKLRSRYMKRLTIYPHEKE